MWLLRIPLGRLVLEKGFFTAARQHSSLMVLKHVDEVTFMFGGLGSGLIPQTD